MRAELVKTTGYVVSTLSVGLLGASAYPGARDAGLLPLLYAGMAASVVGMAMRWWSYRMEKAAKKAALEP